MIHMWNNKYCTEFCLPPQLGPRWAGRTCGLCGNYNGNQGDDFLSGSGLVEAGPQAFGQSWRISGDCESTYKHEADPCVINPKRGMYIHIDTQHQKKNNQTLTPNPCTPCSPFLRRSVCSDDDGRVQSMPFSGEPGTIPTFLSLRCVCVCGWRGVLLLCFVSLCSCLRCQRSLTQVEVSITLW